MDATTKDLFEVAAWTVAGVGGIVAAFRAIREMKATRKNAEEELRWRKAQMAITLLDQIYKDEYARDALIMLDWQGRPFRIDPASDQGEPITHEDIIRALLVDDLSYDPKPLFIRTRMDRLFEGFERIGHALRINLILPDDVKYALDFYVERLARHKPQVEHFMRTQGFDAALELFDRSPAWNPDDAMAETTHRAPGAATAR